MGVFDGFGMDCLGMPRIDMNFLQLYSLEFLVVWRGFTAAFLSIMHPWHRWYQTSKTHGIVSYGHLERNKIFTASFTLLK